MHPSPRRLVTALAAVTIAAFLLGACGGGDREPDATTLLDEANAFTPDERAQMSTTDVAGFDRLPQVISTTSRTGIRYHETGDSGIVVEVTLGPCTEAVCFDLEEDGDDRADDEKDALDERHRDDPNLVFESGLIEAQPGYQAFFVYFRSFVRQGPVVAARDDYRLFYHDGANWLNIVVTPANLDIPDDRAGLEEQMDQARGEEIARTIFAAFAPHYEPR